ncbi:MAG: serine/threonine protein kinase [Planctomycetota bacterium]|nr:MAG: serine/threonine protein kinase [Planctomycetota bacterium]
MAEEVSTAEATGGEGFEWHLSSLRIASPRRTLGGIGPGSVVDGRYEVLEELGRGGMGVVFRVRDRQIGAEFALKLSSTRSGSSAARRVQREGELAAQLDHPGIVKVHSLGEAEEHAYLVCELVEGAVHLGEAFEELDLRGRLELLVEVAAAVGHAHRRGVIHRDLKPGNVLVTPEGKVKVADFGLATVLGLERLTQTGASVGTLTHMAPEQISTERDRRGQGPHTDVWALGVILYWALTGTLPFRGDGAVQVMAKICKGDYEPLRQLDPTLPEALESICARALAVRPTQRYPHAEALAEDLRRFLLGNSAEALLRARRRRWGVVALGAALGFALATTGGVLAGVLAPPAPSATPSPRPRRGEPQPAAARGGEGGWASPEAARDPHGDRWLLDEGRRLRNGGRVGFLRPPAGEPVLALEVPGGVSLWAVANQRTEARRLRRFEGARCWASGARHLFLVDGFAVVHRLPLADLVGEEPEKVAGCPAVPLRLLATPDGRWLVGAGGPELWFRALDGSARARRFDLPAAPRALATGPQDLVAVLVDASEAEPAGKAWTSSRLLLWDPLEEEPLSDRPIEGGVGVAFEPDGAQWLVATQDGRVAAFDATEGTRKPVVRVAGLPGGETVRALGVPSPGRLLLLGEQGLYDVRWPAARVERSLRLVVPNGGVEGLAPWPDDPDVVVLVCSGPKGWFAKLARFPGAAAGSGRGG